MDAKVWVDIGRQSKVIGHDFQLNHLGLPLPCDCSDDAFSLASTL
jgi:hypothetical protein